MNDRQPVQIQVIQQNYLILQPYEAWLAILTFTLFTVLCVITGGGKVLNFAYPTGAFIVAIFLYFRTPLLYIGFVWWMWFLTPLVRRLADYYGGGFNVLSPILLAPFLVSVLTIVTVHKYVVSGRAREAFPFFMVLGSLIYSFCISLIYRPWMTSAIALLDWINPVLLGFHLFTCWQEYTVYRQIIRRIFFWSVLIMGVYGIIQLLILPPWDRYWIENVNMISVGQAIPLHFSVFSTMNDRGIFAVYQMAGLLLLLSSNNSLSIYVFPIGCLAMLLSNVRTAWGGLIIALFIMANSLKPKLQIRLIVTVLVVLALVVPLTRIEGISTIIENRFGTFSAIEEDGSFQGRNAQFEEFRYFDSSSLLGAGLGKRSGDSGMLNILGQLGWFGTIFYGFGLIVMVCRLFLFNEIKFDKFASAARAISVSVLTMLLSGTTVSGITGVIFWSFLGICLAACKVYKNRPLAGTSNSS